MHKCLGTTFRRPRTRTIVRVTGVRRIKGKAYVKIEPDFPDSHLCYGEIPFKQFKKIVSKQ